MPVQREPALPVGLARFADSGPGNFAAAWGRRNHAALGPCGVLPPGSNAAPAKLDLFDVVVLPDGTSGQD